jgi:hypothetical protein
MEWNLWLRLKRTECLIDTRLFNAPFMKTKPITPTKAASKNDVTERLTSSLGIISADNFYC